MPKSIWASANKTVATNSQNNNQNNTDLTEEAILLLYRAEIERLKYENEAQAMRIPWFGKRKENSTWVLLEW